MRERKIAVKTGFADLDRRIDGLHGSDLTIIGGSPSMGKTALALSIVANVSCARKPKAVLLFSTETKKEAIMERLIAAEAGVSLQQVRSGMFPKRKWPALTRAAALMSQSPLFLADTPKAPTIGQVTGLASQLAEELKAKGQELGLIVIDHLQLLRTSSTRSGNRHQDISKISIGLKLLARDSNIPVLALSQLSLRPTAEDGGDTRPTLSDLRAKDLERNADVVMFIYRKSYFNPNDPTIDDNAAEIIVAKNPRGKTGIAKMRFVRDFARFYAQSGSPIERADLSTGSSRRWAKWKTKLVKRGSEVN